MRDLARTTINALLGLWLWTTSSAEGWAALPPYFFADFERGAWTTGSLPRENASVRLVQGKAEIVPLDEAESQQFLELGPSTPFPAVRVDATPIAGGKVVFCEVLARPFAVDEEADEEFFDFGGAVLGFFRVENRGEVRALFGRTKEESVWISTGVQFELDAEGISAHWLRLGVRLDQTTGRWAVRINGVEGLSGLRVVPAPENGGLALWLYAHATHACRFDDLLLSTVEAGHLEKMFAWQERRRAQPTQEPGVAGPKTVTQAKPTAELRHSNQFCAMCSRWLPCCGTGISR